MSQSTGQTDHVQSDSDHVADEEVKSKEAMMKLQEAKPDPIDNYVRIAINNMLTKLDLKGFLRPYEVRTVNYRPLSYVISWLLIFIVPPMFEYDASGTQKTLFYVYLILSCCHYMITIVMLFKRNRNKSNQRKNQQHHSNVIVKYFYIFCGEINKLFHVKANTEAKTKIAPIYGGILLIFGALNCSILFLLITYNQNHSLLQQTQFLTFCCWLSMSLIVALSLLFEESAECRRKKEFEQMNVLSTFPERRSVRKINASKEILVDTLVKNIDKSVKSLIFNQLTWRALRPSHILYFIICSGVIFGYHLTSYIGEFTAASKSVKCVDIYARCISLYCVMILLYTLHRLIVQYKYPLIIMQELSQPINCTRTIDLLAWWKLRRFYRRYQIHSFSIIFDPVVGGVLFIAIIGAAYFIFLSVILYGKSTSFVFTPNEYVLIIFISYLFIYVLVICEIAASTHKVQLSHYDMLTHELISATLNYENEIDIPQYERIQNHVLNCSKPIVILGLEMNSTTIAILRGYFVSAVVFLFFNWLDA
eukprot:125212_1